MLHSNKTFYNIYILLVIIGFFSIGLLSNLFLGGSRVVTIPFRALMLIISLYIIITGVVNNKFIIPSKKTILFFLFWLLYVCRLIVDLYLRDIQATVFDNKLDYILNAIGICIIPVVSLLFAKDIDTEWILKWFYHILFVALIISLFLNLNINSEESQQSYGRYGGGGSLNTINYGHQGVSLSLLSLFLISRAKHNIIKITLYVSSFLLGLFVMYLAGSKSPLVALIICCAFFYCSIKGFFKGIFILLSLSLPFFIFTDHIIGFLSNYGGSFFDRITKALDSGDQSRMWLLGEGFNEFAGSPFTGSAFVLQGQNTGSWNGFYPHNIFIESLMALGIIGGILILGIIAKGWHDSYKVLRTSHSSGWIGLLFIQYSILAMFSNAIYTNHFFWCYVVFVSVVAYLHKNKKAA